MNLSMNIYLGFDDTDDLDAPMGTGRLVREFVCSLPKEYRAVGVVRHQHPRFDDIPFTSNNSSACAIIEMDADGSVEALRALAVEHLHTHCAPGSDPGLCLAQEEAVDAGMIRFGQEATGRRTTQRAAMEIARNVELYGLGGTNDGIIGACAAVGLTRYGWCGRFIEYGALRSLGRALCVEDLVGVGIRVIATDRDPLVPLPTDRVVNAQWIRPSLWAGGPVLQVKQVEPGVWEPAHGKRDKKHACQGGAVTSLCTAV
jgi:tRNA(Ile2) C34 agmatinyltransferase TiaS